MNIEYILMMSFYTLRIIVAFKSENSIKMASSRKIVRDVTVILWYLQTFLANDACHSFHPDMSSS